MIDLGRDFQGINNVLNDLLSKYTKLRFIKFDQAQDNKRVYLTGNITNGFYYKPRKQPITGEVVERVKIVSDNSIIDTAIKSGSMIELIDKDGNFVRYKIKVTKEPQPPSMEWFLEITPNKSDTSPIV